MANSDQVTTVQKKKNSNPVKPIFTTFLVIIILLGISYASLKGLESFDNLRANVYRESSVVVLSALNELWAFFKPIAQLAIVLLVAEWVLEKFGINVGKNTSQFNWTIQSLIAIIVVSAFALAALGGLSNIDALKDVVLVVVGFYFGSQKKSVDIKKEETINVNPVDDTTHTGAAL